MGFQVFFQTIGMTPAFAGRPFFAMFLLAMIGRGWSQQTGLGEPAWFFSETTLIITGLLVLLEVGANYDETARLMLRTGTCARRCSFRTFSASSPSRR